MNKVLKSILKERVGCFIPLETNQQFFPSNHRIYNPQKTAIAKVIHPNENVKPIKDYMLRNFYREAPIPLVLGLSRECTKTDAFIENEVKLFVQSGVSLKFTDAKSNEILGISCSIVWKRNPDYDIIDATIKDWHNTSAEIAHEKPYEERHLVWRDLQYQHIYNLGQKVLQTSGKSFVFYVAMFGLNKKIRGTIPLGEIMQHDKILQNCTMLCQSNFRAWESVVYNSWRNPVICEELKYLDEELCLDEKSGRAFKVIDHLDSLRFFVDY